MSKSSFFLVFSTAGRNLRSVVIHFLQEGFLRKFKPLKSIILVFLRLLSSASHLSRSFTAIFCIPYHTLTSCWSAPKISIANFSFFRNFLSHRFIKERMQLHLYFDGANEKHKAAFERHVRHITRALFKSSLLRDLVIERSMVFLVVCKYWFFALLWNYLTIWFPSHFWH